VWYLALTPRCSRQHILCRYSRLRWLRCSVLQYVLQCVAVCVTEFYSVCYSVLQCDTALLLACRRNTFHVATRAFSGCVAVCGCGAVCVAVC